MTYIGNNLTIQQYAPQIAYFSGNGSTTAFTLPQAVVSSAQILVFVANVPQNPSSAYTVSGTTLTFTSAPPSGTNNIWVEYTSLQTNTVVPSYGTVGPLQINSAYSLWNLSGSDINYTAGNVGIGTSSPSARLTIDTNAANYTDGITIANRASFGYGSSLNFANIPSSGGSLTTVSRIQQYYQASNLYGLTFSVYNSALNEAMRIDYSGNLLVGTTSATVSGSSYKEVLNQSTSGTGRCLAITDNINTSGFAIAIFSTGGYAGGISYSGTTATFNSSSDYRLKNNTTPIQNALNTISQLNPVTFTWRFDNRADAGFLAHEFQSILPNYVQGEKDAIDKDGNPEYQSMDNSGVIPFLVKAIQEQQVLIESLTTRLTALENK